MPTNVTPPIRTPLLTQNGAPLSVGNADVQTTRDWWLYWNQLGDQVNANSNLVGQGTHGSRPDPTAIPDGSLYVESDRTVLYYTDGGEWHYLAGTMWGTLSPDQRPTDLGVNDAGFEFRTDDLDPAYAPRQFLWSGSEWVETTMVLYGSHAARPAANEQTPPRTIYVESDRSGVIYQQQANVWHFLAGTMWGTLSPDQRPTDLGVSDAGFAYRGTDVQREFIWGGGAWAEVTPIGGGANLTHPNVVTKVGTAGQIVEGGITDLSAANSGYLTVTATGQVCIRGASATGFLNVNDPSGGSVLLRLQNNGGPAFDFTRNVTTGALLIQGTQGGFNHIVLCPTGGNVAIGIGSSSNPTYQLQLAADSAGKPATSTWSVISDLRLKQNISPVKDDSLAILGKLSWVRYEYNGQAGTPRGEKAIGLVAQALQEQLPEAVRSTKTKLNEIDADETDVLAIDYHHIIVHSARAIQQLEAEVRSLRALIGKP